MPKPAIIIVPGAFHRPIHYQRLVEHLSKAGFDALAVEMPSVNSSPPRPDWTADANAVREAIVKFLDKGQDVITVAHSFGGVAMSEGVQGLGLEQRVKSGFQTGVRKLVYMCAVALPKGQTHLGQIAPVTEEEIEASKEQQRFAEENGGMGFNEEGAMVMNPVVARETLFNRCDPEDIEMALENFGSFPMGPLSVPVTYSAFEEIPSVYIMCRNDKALLLPCQERIIAQGKGAFVVEQCDEGHSPFLSNPGFITDCVRRAAGEAV